MNAKKLSIVKEQFTQRSYGMWSRIRGLENVACKITSTLRFGAASIGQVFLRIACQSVSDSVSLRRAFGE